MAVLEDNFMMKLAENAVKVALKKGAQEAEAYVYEGQATNIGIELGQISKTNRVIDRGLGIRVIVNKTIGFAYTNIINDTQAIERVAEKALSAVRASKPDNGWRGLPQKRLYPKTQRTFDQRIVDLNSEDIVNIASNMLDAAGGIDKRVFPVEGGVGSGYISGAIANSNGISGFDKGTIIECSVATLGKENRSVTPVCFEFNASREYNLNPEWVGREAAKLAASAIKTKSVETKSC